MPDTARGRILQRLHRAAPSSPERPAAACRPAPAFDRARRMERLISLMGAMHTRIEVTTARQWPQRLVSILRGRNLKRLLYAPETAAGEQLRTAWPDQAPDLPGLCTWQGPIEDFKDELFQIDAALTTARGAVAETGAIVLWPDAGQPRLMSLVPPVHIALLEADRIYDNFCDIMEAENWPDHMPTNALLISGPSKTADIEMTLAFGVHGPRELIVLIIDSDRQVASK